MENHRIVAGTITGRATASSMQILVRPWHTGAPNALQFGPYAFLPGAVERRHLDMVDHRSDFVSGQQLSSQQVEHERRLLELQLIQIRKEATAARLEARAAELEIMLRRIASAESGVAMMLEPMLPSAAAPISIGSPNVVSPDQRVRDEATVKSSPRSFHGVQDRKTLRAVHSKAVSFDLQAGSLIDSDQASSCEPETQPARRTNALDPESNSQQASLRQKASQGAAPHQMPRSKSSRRTSRSKSERSASAASRPNPDKPIPATRSAKRSAKAEPIARPGRLPAGGSAPLAGVDQRKQSESLKGDSPLPQPPDRAPEEAIDQKRKKQTRPTAVLFSAAIHIGLLVLLAAVTLRSQQPLDQVTLTATVADASPESLTTVTIESSEPQVDRTEMPETEVDVNLEQPTELSRVDMNTSVAPLASLESMLGSDSGSTSVESLNAGVSSAEKITFCGVEGGGNHFVYLVDCSKSMGSAFDSARAELLQSIDALKPEQRFFVIFFDASPDYMRVSRPDVNDSKSVLATPANKRALRSWATTIKMDSGAAPYDPLKFALQLRPDVIFLLSDGEFPAGIEELLRAENRVENLFGDARIKSIVHTIGYHSRAGENRMRSIAAQNQGQYRYVPQPPR